MDEFTRTLIATFVGAALALGADRIAKWSDARRTERVAIDNLLIDLAAKRALAPATLDDPWSPGSPERILESVNHMRSQIREARMQLRPNSKYLEPLRKMTRACATFLTQSEYRADGPTKHDLSELGKAMRAEALAIHSVAPSKVVKDMPGEFSLDDSIDPGLVEQAE
jgi:hypothetical protein